VSSIAGRSAWPRARPEAVDAAGALLLFGGALLEAWLSGVSGPAIATATAVCLTTLPLAWRSRAPLPVAILTLAGLPLAVILGLPAGELLVPYLAPLVAIYAVGQGSSASAMAIVAIWALAAAATVVVAANPGGRVADIGYTAAGVVASLAVGRAVRAMGFESDALEARAAELERTREEGARAAVEAERARIARELHDVIGHSISVMGVQAGAVRRVLPPELARERDALLAVERVGRDAVTEVKRVLGLLRTGDREASPPEPLPTLRRLDDLVAEMRAAGLDVDLRVEGELDDLSAGRGLVAFRILQEALTNALRHAAGAHVDAVVRRTQDELAVEVEDDGESGRPPSPAGAGYGLIGMRERIELYGGSLTAGPTPGGGYRVAARLPAVD
jgi:signal transduction histidine kinase